MFRGGFCFIARTNLRSRSRSIYGQFYIENSLLEDVIPFGPFLQNFSLMQGNACCSSYGLATKNPIWAALKQAVRCYTPPPTNLRELEEVVLLQGENIPQESIQNLIRRRRRLYSLLIFSLWSVIFGIIEKSINRDLEKALSFNYAITAIILFC